ncbi:MAG: RtcB family protein, partial [Candidatus Omnitrophica bacterium]|nr:RtcB family protein [Candidatus Omnitrophota bacterium]
MISKSDLVKISDFLWEIPQDFRHDMRVPARVYASEKTIEEILKDRTIWQLVNVATLPGIQKYALAMPDAHEGYGFPVGGVAAFDINEGVISPGGIGYDINCGVRLLRSSKTYNEIKPYLEKLGQRIYSEVPSGVGRGGRLRLNNFDLDSILKNGLRRLIEIGYGNGQDLLRVESKGTLERAEPGMVSRNAKMRGHDQLGTMGAGNHFVEVERIEVIFDQEIAKRLNLFEDQVCVLIHTGSRGLGHQVATDYIRLMMKSMNKYKITLPDREL